MVIAVCEMRDQSAASVGDEEEAAVPFSGHVSPIVEADGKSSRVTERKLKKIFVLGSA